jgi:hypothetical protein
MITMVFSKKNKIGKSFSLYSIHMPLIQASAFSPINAPSAGVIPQPYVSSLSGESYKYASKGGRRANKKHQKRTKKAKQNRRSRRTRSNR